MAYHHFLIEMYALILMMTPLNLIQATASLHDVQKGKDAPD